MLGDTERPSTDIAAAAAGGTVRIGGAPLAIAAGRCRGPDWELDVLDVLDSALLLVLVLAAAGGQAALAERASS